jgi:hypothetical protein
VAGSLGHSDAVRLARSRCGALRASRKVYRLADPIGRSPSIETGQGLAGGLPPLGAPTRKGDRVRHPLTWIEWAAWIGNTSRVRYTPWVRYTSWVGNAPRIGNAAWISNSSRTWAPVAHRQQAQEDWEQEKTQDPPRSVFVSRLIHCLSP